MLHTVFLWLWRVEATLVTAHRLLILLAPLVAPCRLSGVWASVAVAHRPSCPVACGIFWAVDRTGVPCIAKKKMLSHWASREVLSMGFYCPLFAISKMWCTHSVGYYLTLNRKGILTCE